MYDECLTRTPESRNICKNICYYYVYIWKFLNEKYCRMAGCVTRRGPLCIFNCFFFTGRFFKFLYYELLTFFAAKIKINEQIHKSR